MEEDHFLHEEAPAKHDLIDVVVPGGVGGIAELGVEAEVSALSRETGRGVEAGVRVRLRPWAQGEVVELVRRDEVAYGPERSHGTGEGFVERDRRPDPDASVTQADDGHSGRIRELAEEADRGAVSDPEVGAERFEHTRAVCTRNLQHGAAMAPGHRPKRLGIAYLWRAPFREDEAIVEESNASPTRGWLGRIAAELRSRPAAYVIMGLFMIAGPLVTAWVFPDAPRGAGLVGGLAFGAYAALCAVPEKFL